MIPKIIHYCWYGKNPKPDIIAKCIASWKIYCYDYIIIEWNEENSELPFDLPFIRKAYDDEKWAFVADYMRYKVIKNHGGIYLDTDILLIKPLDQLLDNEIFFCYEDKYDHICSGVFGAIKGNPYLNHFLDYYSKLKVAENFKLIDHIIPKVLGEIYYSKDSKHIKIYPFHLFYAMPYYNRYENYEKYINEESIGVHMWTATWRDKTATFYLRERFILKSYKALFNHIFIKPNIYEVYLYFRTVFSFFLRKLFFIKPK
jgi:mannosyltransferase OCH1-like enzyme